MFVIPKMDDPSKLRYIHDLVKRHEETKLQPALIPSQSLIRNVVATHPFRSKIDISDGYHTIRVHPPMRSILHFLPHMAPTGLESCSNVTVMLLPPSKTL